MILAGIVPSSLIDYPEKVSAVIFTKGCNFRCPYCHNPELVVGKETSHISEIDFFDLLKKRTGLLDGVVISGGEPTLHSDLLHFVEKIKGMGFLIKIDTNGSKPEIIQTLLEKELVDYIAMDVKASPDQYVSTAGYNGSIEPIFQTIKLLEKSSVFHEFRTTVVPGFTNEEEIEKIGKMIEGSKKYFIQNFRPSNTLLNELSKQRGFSIAELEHFKEIALKYVLNVEIRN